MLTSFRHSVSFTVLLVQDGDFSERRFRDIVNAALANDIGNLLNRTLNLLKKNCQGSMPADSDQIPGDSPVRQMAQQQVRYHQNVPYYQKAVDNHLLSNSTFEIMQFRSSCCSASYALCLSRAISTGDVGFEPASI